MEIVELVCPGCGRSLKQAQTVVLQRMKQGKPMRCLVCAKELKLPADLVAKLAAPVVESVRRLGRCPACLRPAQAQGEPPLVRGWCSGCQAAFLCEQPGQGTFDLPAATRAAPAEVEQAISRLPVRPLGALMSLALRRRCERGALAQGEATRLAHMAEGLARWRGATAVPQLPWVPAEVQRLLGPFVFSSNHVRPDEKTGITYLRNELTLDSPGGMGAGTSLALNTVGIGLLLATGTGFTVGGGDAPPPETLSQEYWVRLHPTQGGSVLEVAAAQNGTQPQALSQAEQTALAQRLFDLRHLLERYVRAVALCSESLRGVASKGLIVEAARARLVDVGASAADAARYAADFVVTA